MGNNKEFGFIYFIGAIIDNKTRVKIGKTRTHPKYRLSSLQTGSPIKLHLLGYYLTNDTESYEKWEHDTHRHERLNGEWFAIPFEIGLKHQRYDGVPIIKIVQTGGGIPVDEQIKEIRNLRKEVRKWYLKMFPHSY